MRLEVIRMLKAGAEDATIGVGAMIADLTLDGSDALPDVPTIVASTDNGYVARRTFPEDGVTYPVLAIVNNVPASIEEFHTAVRDGEVTIDFAFVERSSDTAKGDRDALYTARAVLRFLKLFFDNAHASMRVKNGIQIVDPIKTLDGPVFEKWGAGLVMNVTRVTMRVRETQP